MCSIINLIFTVNREFKLSGNDEIDNQRGSLCKRYFAAPISIELIFQGWSHFGSSDIVLRRNMLSYILVYYLLQVKPLTLTNGIVQGNAMCRNLNVLFGILLVHDSLPIFLVSKA